jgi:hypothetical protein
MKNSITYLLLVTASLLFHNAFSQNNPSGNKGFTPGFASKSDVASDFRFNHSVQMEIQSVSKKGKAEPVVNYEMLLGGNHPAFGVKVAMEGANSTIFWDTEKSIMVTLVDSPAMKMGIAMKFDPAALPSDEDNVAESDMKFKKTGRTKILLGHECHEYTAEDDDSIAEFWMAPSVDLNLAGPFGTMMMNNGNANASGYPSGFMMEMTSTGKKKGEKTTMRVTKIEKNKETVINTSSYSFMH